MGINRRSALKVLAVGGMAAVTGREARAGRTTQAPEQAMGMLYDTTRCIGCKTCVVACKEANDRQPEPGSWSDGALYDAPVDLSGDTKNIIKLFDDGTYTSFMKSQCMHCIDPACAAACMLGSLQKDPVTGVVSYDPDYCVGCRYCVMACPFNVAKFEFSKSVPNIVKCELCRHRVKDEAAQRDGFTRYPDGQGPACCEVCPREAVIYGTREELLAEAHGRIEANPGRYFEDRVYGEKDGGGTQVLYLSHVPFSALGLPALGERGTPDVAYKVQEGIYYKLPFVAPVALYAALVVTQFRNRRANRIEPDSGAAS